MVKPLGITEVVLRDAHQSLLATRLRIEDMLPIAANGPGRFLVHGEWGGATFDACIRYLGEDPWERLRTIKKAMPNTPQQMLLRGQNLLGYRHYADDVVDKFIERAAYNGVDVFRIFDAIERCPQLRARDQGGHRLRQACPRNDFLYGQPCPHHRYVGRSRPNAGRYGAHSISIKDMAGLLKPYVAEELVKRLKKSVKYAHPYAVPCHDRLEHGHHHQGGGSGHRQCRHGHFLHEHDLRAQPDRIRCRDFSGHKARHRSGHHAIWKKSPPIFARSERNIPSSKVPSKEWTVASWSPRCRGAC